ncbi:flocculation protein FLO11 [Cucumis sativus]|nr:flocculation protein FLO11 [Cucumis sativus]KAE8652109.1 hypothetical protein Csa_022237 [Cucumis sativus]
MSLSQLRILLPWQSLKASSRSANESPERSFGPTDESEGSASAADTVPNIRHQPDQSPETKPEEPPLATAQAAERSETMPPSKSHKAGKVHSQPSTTRAKNRSRAASKPSSSSKAIPQFSVASDKPSTSGKGSQSQDSSKPSSPAGKVFSPSKDASSKPSSPATVAATPPRIASKASSSSSQTSNKKHPNSKPTSQLKVKADSQPSSSSRSALPSRDPSLPAQSLSQEDSRQQSSEKTSRVQSPSNLSRKPTTQSTSKQPVESPATIRIQSHPNSKQPSQSRFKADSHPSPSSRSTFPSQDFSTPPRSPSHEISRQQPSVKTSRVQSPSHSSRKSTAQSTTQQPTESPATIGIQHHPNLKPSLSQSRFKADSQPSSSSKLKFPSQDSSMPPRSPSQENSLQPPSEKTFRVQSPSHLSRKPTAQSTSQQPIEPTASIGDQTTDRILSDPANPSPKAIPTSGESQIQAESKKSPKPNVKPVELEESKTQHETKEELTSKNENKEELASKNTSNPHSYKDSSENPTQSDQAIEKGLDSSLESQTESKETKEDGAKTTNAFQTKASRSTLITSSKSRSSFEPENNTQQDESMEDLSKAFNKLNIKYSDEENPKSLTTMIGDNKGTSMHLLSDEAKSESSIHVNHHYKSNPDQSPESSTDIKENSNNETAKDSTTEENPDPPPLELYINLNVQGINNSITFNTSFTENNPGIKLKFPGEPTNCQDELESDHHTRKSKYIATPAEKVTYDPRIRRRCLEGLLMESSDSEDENPGKLQPHGCRYSGSSKGKEVETLY